MKRKTRCSAALVAGAVLAGTSPATAQDAGSPPAATPAEGPAPAPPYTVTTGDSLSRISAGVLGTSDRWVEIFVLNRGLIQDPNRIEVGQVLQIPSAPVPVPPDLLAPPSAAAPPAAATDVTASATSPRPASSGGGGGAADLAGIRRCESGGNYQAVSPNGRYRGAYQFDRETWASVGGSGDPAAASPAEQDARARQLKSQRGRSPWSNCG